MPQVTCAMCASEAQGKVHDAARMTVCTTMARPVGGFDPCVLGRFSAILGVISVSKREVWTT